MLLLLPQSLSGLSRRGRREKHSDGNRQTIPHRAIVDLLRVRWAVQFAPARPNPAFGDLGVVVGLQFVPSSLLGCPSPLIHRSACVHHSLGAALGGRPERDGAPLRRRELPLPSHPRVAAARIATFQPIQTAQYSPLLFAECGRPPSQIDTDKNGMLSAEELKGLLNGIKHKSLSANLDRARLLLSPPPRA